ncbi:immunity 49 family protein [Streptomyces celluloflavus]|uniref:immunity 49 family protein n=1 Tax=Streptomyces celluloflavus TaxID=58344 RepID=UPI00368BED3E
MPGRSEKPSRARHCDIASPGRLKIPFGMFSIITHHPFPKGNAEDGLAVLQENAQELIDGLEADTANLGDALGTTLTLAEAHCLLDPRAAIFPTWDAWVNAMQVGSALFAAATTPDEHVQCRIAHKDRMLPATGPQWYVHPGSWLSAFYLAVVCREKDRITALCQAPLSLLRENGSRFGEYDCAWTGGTSNCPARRWRWRWSCSGGSRAAWSRCSASGSWRRSTRPVRGTGAGSTPWAWTRTAAQW